MNARRMDLIAAILLLAFAIAWSVTVYRTVPDSVYGIGPKDFPLVMGIILIVMSVLLLLRTLSTDQGTEEVKGDEADDSEVAGGGKYAVGVLLLIILYGFLIERIGFLLTTPIIIVVALAGILRIRNPVSILAVAIGITAGSWLVFNKILGVYMPPGSWIPFHI